MRRRMTLVAAAMFMVAAATAAGATYAAVTNIHEPNANGVISSCYDSATGRIRMVNAAATCTTAEQKLTWQQKVRRPVVHVVGEAGQPGYAFDWKAYDGPPFGNLSFFKDASGVVHLSGLACRVSFADPSACVSGTAFGGTQRIFTLPAGFRPGTQQLFTAMTSGQTNYYVTRVDVTTAGVVELVTPPTGGEDWISFDGMTFLAG
jgi:hypothetical protein